MNNLPDEFFRTITVGEVKEWLGKSAKSKLNEPQYCAIAAYLTRCKWPGDPPAPPDSPWLARTIDDDRKQWWDCKRVGQVARTLLDNMPAIVSRLEKTQRSDKDAARTLQEVLSKIVEYVEWPFGRYERQSGQKPIKLWHTYAQLIARTVISAIIEAGHESPAVTNNSVVVGVVQKAMIKMNVPNANVISRGAIGAYLTRWDKKFGMTPKGIAALTTKQVDSFVTMPI
jgi:hypothetical protein